MCSRVSFFAALEAVGRSPRRCMHLLRPASQISMANFGTLPLTPGKQPPGSFPRSVPRWPDVSMCHCSSICKESFGQRRRWNGRPYKAAEPNSYASRTAASFDVLEEVAAQASRVALQVGKLWYHGRRRRDMFLRQFAKSVRHFTRLLGRLVRSLGRRGNGCRLLEVEARSLRVCTS